MQRDCVQSESAHSEKCEVSERQDLSENTRSLPPRTAGNQSCYPFKFAVVHVINMTEKRQNLEGHLDEALFAVRPDEMVVGKDTPGDVSAHRVQQAREQRQGVPVHNIFILLPRRYCTQQNLQNTGAEGLLVHNRS
jgi:hypothetical protein